MNHAFAREASIDVSEATPPWRLGLLLHFFAHMGLAADADAPLTERGFGRVHHRILYLAHFAPGISVGELLTVLRMTHQNAQRALRQLDQEGLIEFKLSKEDRRLKLLHSTPKGDQLLDVITTHQRERITKAYEQCSPRDVEGFFAVLGKMIDSNDQQWIDRLAAARQPGQ
ncbi:MarR family transcriptional regulator [Caballeronia sp. LjRoot34]|uniref:MarR family winged helix-turn-helix transcriptional regulator n=1 Tax=Caballeronia sp. LjRoot34 TaxID=3342325 RepID=UPI003ECE3A4B